MAITTFSELKTAVATWVDRTDLTSRIPEFIALFEAEVNRTFKVRDMDAVDTALAITSGVATVPSGFLAVRSFRLTSDPYNRIDFLPIDQIEALDPADTGKPMYYDRVGSSFIFYPPTTGTARLRYRKAITPLSDAAPSNWLLASHPDIYLFGACTQADLFNVDPERLAGWRAGLDLAMQQLADLDMSINADTVQMQPSGMVI